jgi:hypothetical protein
MPEIPIDNKYNAPISKSEKDINIKIKKNKIIFS